MSDTRTEIAVLEERLRLAELGPDPKFFEEVLADEVVLVAACGCGNAEETTCDWMRSAAQAAAVTRVLRLARCELMERPSW